MALTEQDFQSAADDLGVDVASVKAVTKVESRGSGFLLSGVPKILFERHWMFKLLKRKLGRDPEINDVCNPKAGGYLGGQAEHERLDKAVKMDRDCALQSASWGLFQIMGFHWEALGYASVQAFVNAQYASEGSQLNTFVRFIKTNPAIHKALKSKNWAEFARRYNGPDYKKNNYDVKLAEAYKSFK
ncbi:endolysin [Pseudomonas phage vB_Paer_PsCh]|uniref:Endolysin n=1 Tax=Pseudomonas phage vB_Paer_PsCh TaxID=2924906 RepID=A0AAE9GRT0_9CAUD|nr:endolysin [Pseudomonas phage vB_Paer_PsCh]UOL47862.1 endolysin [Pseudomonas phage vB_Paer_PsCh]